jgi:hypothetical protein
MGSDSCNIHSIKIKHRDTEFKLHLVPIYDIRPHERSVNILKEELKNQLLNDGVLRDPILADYKRGLVIDGTHRILALREIGVDYIVIQHIDYLDDGLKLYRWFRIYDKPDKDIIEILKNVKGTKEFDIRDLDRYSMYIVYNGKTYIILDDAELEDIVENIETLTEKFSTQYNMKPYYISEDELDNIDIKKFEGILIGYRVIDKSEVLDVHSKHVLLHNKATRHVPPYRIININIPLKLLSKDYLYDAIEYIKGIKLEYLGEKIVLEGRYYAEKVFKGVREDINKG